MGLLPREQVEREKRGGPGCVIMPQTEPLYPGEAEGDWGRGVCGGGGGLGSVTAVYGRLCTENLIGQWEKFMTGRLNGEFPQRSRGPIAFKLWLCWK